MLIFIVKTNHKAVLLMVDMFIQAPVTQCEQTTTGSVPNYYSPLSQKGTVYFNILTFPVCKDVRSSSWTPLPRR